MCKLMSKDARYWLTVVCIAAGWAILGSDAALGQSECTSTAGLRYGPTDGGAIDELGTSVAMQSNTALIGAPGRINPDPSLPAYTHTGAVYLARRSGSTWTLGATPIFPPDGANQDRFGQSVSMDNTWAVVGAPNDDSNSGSAYVLQSNTDGSAWTYRQKLVPPLRAPGEYFGQSVAISGSTIVIGAYGNGLYTGKAYVYRLVGSTWSWVDTLVAPDAATYDYFGYAVAVSGNVIVVGSYGDDIIGTNSGSVYAFRSSDGGASWEYTQKIWPSTIDTSYNSGSMFGVSLAMAGGIAAIGAQGDDSAAGSVRIFRDNGLNFLPEAKLTASDRKPSDRFGNSISIDGSLVLVGTMYWRNPANASIQQGKAYLFGDDGATWNEELSLVQPATWARDGDYFGSAVVLDGAGIWVGASGENPPAATNSGKAYYFDIDCTASTPVPDCVVNTDCNDGNPCTNDSCASGTCTNSYNTATCPDDGNACTNDVCSAGTCTHPAKANGTACGSATVTDCSLADTCVSGACSPNNKTSGTACTTDNNACTNDSCNASGVCAHNPLASGSTCGDGLYCNGADTCNASGVCIHAGNPCPGPDGDADCSETCNEATGTCTTNDPDNSLCNDGNALTTDDRCTAGVCAGTAPECVTSADCNDNNPCTTDSCVSGTCQRVNNTLACTDDGNACTNDVCNAGACTHPAKTAGTACNDGIYCNGADTCSNGTCSVHSGNPCPGPDGDSDCSETCNEATDSCTANDPDNSACNDGNALTANDICTAGVCAGTAPECVTNADCNDNNPCTTDSCVSGACQRVNNTLACADDGNACTNDVCGGGACSHPAKANGTTCSDGLYCNGADTCSSGTCSTHAGNPCPGADGDADCSETCNEASDNCTANDPNNSVCNDGNAATTGDYCNAGVCVGGAPVVPPQCLTNADCNDNNVCTTDSCVSGACQRVNNTLVCADDGNACTNDVCGGGACTHPAKANGTACSDGLYCNGADTCSSGTCSTHAGNPCPGADGDADCSETCNEASDNCTTNDPNNSVCNDGNASTTGDHCSSGACVGTQCRRKNQVCTQNSECCSQICGQNGKCR